MKFLQKELKVPAIIIALIVVVSILFHYTIHIENALTLQPASEFGIRISFCRILFEPVLGLLLFFNRSFYALTELRFLLFWVLVVYAVYSLTKSFLVKERQLRRKYIVGQLVNIPIILGLWFAVFVVIIFIPLPNNTIANHSSDKILVTTHSHTDFSHDGLISEENLWKWHQRNGYDAFFITDHNNHSRTLDFVQAQRDHKFPGEPLVMCGEEFSGSNHLSLLGLRERFLTKGCSDSTVIQLAHAGNGAVIVNHWFDGEHKSLEYYRNLGVDGYEIENSATDLSYDRKVYHRIKDFCEHNNLVMNGGLDFHGYGNACSLWNAFEIPGWHNLDPASKEEAILKIIKSCDQSKLQVLLYKDRPYYTKKYLYLSPLFTFFNYFRTLNFYQVFSWILWILIVAGIRIRFSGPNKTAKRIPENRLVPFSGVLSALFMLCLGLFYFTGIKDLPDYTKMYHEYSNLLFTAGAVFLVYSGLVTFFRNRSASKR